VTSSIRYYREDVAYFVRTSPYLQLATPSAAERFLSLQLSAAADCGADLAQYPRILSEPLDFFYQCLRSLGALDVPFLQALLTDHDWRGAVWGAWLALLELDPDFVPTLTAASNRWPQNDWLVQCALATIQGAAAPPESETVVQLAAQYRALLRGIARPVTRIRSEPTPQQSAQMDAERASIRAAYAQGGADAARLALRGSLAELYSQDYPTWISGVSASRVGS